MKLVIQGKNIDITEAIREHVSQKIEKSVSHFQRMINEVDDLVADKISRQLRKYKEKRQSSDHVSLRSMDVDVSSNDADLQVTELLEQRQPQLPEEVVRTKYFAMAPMAVQEALENLQLVDHDFYVFHNAETNQINVMYERNHGGYGLIQPRPATANGHKEGDVVLNHNGHADHGHRLQSAPVRR